MTARGDGRSGAMFIVDAMRDDLVIPELLLDIVQCSQNLVRWEIEATTPSGPYTLSTCFPSGRLVQVFDRASAALARQAEVQEMLVLHAQRSFLTSRRYGDGRRHSNSAAVKVRRLFTNS